MKLSKAFAIAVTLAVAGSVHSGLAQQPAAALAAIEPAVAAACHRTEGTGKILKAMSSRLEAAKSLSFTVKTASMSRRRMVSRYSTWCNRTFPATAGQAEGCCRWGRAAFGILL